ncbi:hypothetical protein ADUPG1_012649, partial [Aduncisulcus paluster]
MLIQKMRIEKLESRIRELEPSLDDESGKRRIVEGEVRSLMDDMRSLRKEWTSEKSILRSSERIRREEEEEKGRRRREEERIRREEERIRREEEEEGRRRREQEIIRREEEARREEDKRREDQRDSLRRSERMDRTTVDSTMHGSDLATSSSSSWPVGLFRPKKQHKSFSPPAQAIVLYTFKARPGNSDELSIERGEHVNVYYQTQGGWSGCTSSSGSAGTVPSSYIKLIEGEEMNEVDPNFYNTTSTRTTTDGDATSTHHIQPPSSSPPRGFKKDTRRSSKLSTY